VQKRGGRGFFYGQKRKSGCIEKNGKKKEMISQEIPLGTNNTATFPVFTGQKKNRKKRERTAGSVITASKPNQNAEPTEVKGTKTV